MKRPFHGIEGLSLTGEKAEPDQAMEVFWHFFAGRLPGSKNFAILEAQLDDGHSVLGQSAGFVRTQHRCGAEGFDGGSTSGQDTRPRDSPRTHRHEDGEHNRQLFGEHRHAERDASKHRIEPSSAQGAVKQHRQDAHRATGHGEHTHKPPGLCLQAWLLSLQSAQRLADLADLAQCAGRDHFTYSPAAYNQ